MKDPIKGDPSFRKFGSIENSYQNKVIARWSNHFPELTVSKFIVMEKIDGSCMGVYITEDNIVYNSRRKILEETDSFNEYLRVFAGYQSHLDAIQNYVKTTDGVDSVRIYGEIFGNVITRVNYGDVNDFKVFEVLVNDTPLTIKTGMDFLTDLGINDWWVPVFGIFDNFQDAYDFDIDVDTKAITGTQRTGDNVCNKIEGVVIAPYDVMFSYEHEDEGTSVFKLKKKSEKFNDKASNKKPYEEFVGSEEYTRLAGIWSGLINENRLLDLFSKEGMIQGPKEIGKYIPKMLADVKEDFFKEHKDAFILLTDTEKKKIISSTASLVVPLLQAHL